jgi:hypothetical protein
LLEGSISYFFTTETQRKRRRKNFFYRNPVDYRQDAKIAKVTHNFFSPPRRIRLRPVEIDRTSSDRKEDEKKEILFAEIEKDSLHFYRPQPRDPNPESRFYLPPRHQGTKENQGSGVRD